MIDLRTAVKKAEQYAVELFSEQELRHLRLEEVELSEPENVWKITLGWVDSAVTPPNVLLGGLTGGGQRLPRVYKTFHVDAQSGEVKAMKIRNVEQ